MGDTSIIARRLENGKVQYGWSGNGGVFAAVGSRLLYWYNDPDSVEYLFSLGQLSLLYEPHSEQKDCLLRTLPTGEPHWIGESEREIFSKIMFVDMGYFYDLDNTWYYVDPGPFRIKIPLMLMAMCVEPVEGRRYWEGDFLRKVEDLLMEKITARYDEDQEFRTYLSEHDCDKARFLEIMEDVSHNDAPLETKAMRLWERHRFVFDYFDDWAVVIPNRDQTAIRNIWIQKKEEPHQETLGWDQWFDADEWRECNDVPDERSEPNDWAEE